MPSLLSRFKAAFLASKRSGPTLCVIFIVVLALIAYHHHTPPVTEQVAAPHISKKQREELQAQRTAAVKQACEVRKLCRQYATARQQCATAGSYDKCMSIKIVSPYSPQAECTDDGQVRYPLADQPGDVECLIYSLE